MEKTTGAGSFGGATGQPLIDEGRPARRDPRFVSSGKRGQYPQGEARQSAPTLGPRRPASATPWRQVVHPPGPNIPQPGARNARPGPRQQHASSAAGSVATLHQLRERQEQHRTEQAVKAARPDAPTGRHALYGVFKLKVGGAHPERMYEGLRPRVKVRAATAQVCAGGEVRLGVREGGRFGLMRATGF